MSEVVATNLGVMPRVAGLLAALGPIRGLRIADIGCGEGQVAASLAERGGIVTGYDPFMSSTDWMARGEGKYRIAVATADAIPEADASFDVVVFVFSLHHVPGPQMAGAIVEAHRLLRPSGRLCVAEPLPEGPNQYVMELYHDETPVRKMAQTALNLHAVPVFESERVFTFSERRLFPDFDTFAAQGIAGTRFNNYTAEQVLAPEVRSRFSKMFAVHGECFDLPIKLNVYSGPQPR
jgi:ubiquinone/menaquinone biosynthesis C-methylase UbiE